MSLFGRYIDISRWGLDLQTLEILTVMVILLFVVILLLLFGSRSRKEIRELRKISEQLKENGEHQPQQQVLHYIPVCPQVKPANTVVTGETAAKETPETEAATEAPGAAVEGQPAPEKTADPLEEILNFSFLTESEPKVEKEDISNLGKSGKRYNKEELEALIKN